MGAESALVQTIGTLLQLIGAAITLGGLLWAWHVLTVALNQWREAARGRLSRLRDSLASLGKPTPTGTGTAKGSSYGQTTTAIGVAPTIGTLEERITQLQGELAQHRASVAATLRTAIDDAIAAEREESKVVRLHEIYWAAGGIAVSTAGYLCQLIG